MLRKALLVTVSVIAVLLIGATGMRLLMSKRVPQQRQVSENLGTLVRVMNVQPKELPLTIAGFGVVRPRTKWSAMLEVSGAVVMLAPNLRSGLHVSKGELLVEIDPRAYRLAELRWRAEIEQNRKEIGVLQQQRKNYEATLQIAQRNLEIADEQLHRDETLVQKGVISSRELEARRQSRNEFAQTVQTARNGLALVGPQIEKTKATLEVAKTQLADAILKQSKTRLIAPFDGQVLSRNVELGESVQAGEEVAVLYDTAAVEIPIALTLDDLSWLPAFFPDSLPHVSHSTGHARTQDGEQWVLPEATVHCQIRGREYTWPGRVKRWEAMLDEQTRTTRLVVEVQEPWEAFRLGKLPLLQLGMFCQAEIVARHIPQAVVIPRMALHENDTVYVVHEGTLAVRPVQVLRVQGDQAIITSGLNREDKLITSPLTAAVVGMKLRTLETDGHEALSATVSSIPDSDR